MHCTVDEMRARMTVREYMDWATLYSVEPWGEKRDDLHAGIVASTFANAFRGKGQKAFKPADFMPDERRSRMARDPKQMQAQLKALMVQQRAMGIK